jgi:hypothetical protein
MRCNVCGSQFHEATTAGCPAAMVIPYGAPHTLVPADGVVGCTSCHSLRAQLEKVEIEKGALQVAYDDLRGKVLGQCGQCNMLERADCYRRQDTAYQRGAREMRERAAELAHPIDECLFDDIMDLPTGSSESAKV